MAHNIFISYRRINGDIMARMICDGLRATNRYDNIYLDVDVAGVDRVRINARRDGPYIEGKDPSLFSADMILKNEVLRR